jgi:hypothetical protein
MFNDHREEICYEKLNRIPEFRTYFANQILFVYYVYHSKSLRRDELSDVEIDTI